MDILQKLLSFVGGALPLVLGGLAAFWLGSWIISLRRVVQTNMTHVVQSGRKTLSFGAGQVAGNVYYEWPNWVPVIGVSVIKLPVSNFSLSLKDYEAYDKDRVPFVVDIVAFFRIFNTALAAERVVTVSDLESQLVQIVQGAARKILANDTIDAIMTERAKFGEQFTQDVEEQLKQWGVEAVKSMELMDIRDARDSQVIHNIMAKKISHIAMESRVEVAKNDQAAETAEINAKQAVDVRAQEAEQVVGQRTAEKDKQIGIAQEQSQQEVLAAAKITTERQMAVQTVQDVQTAEIAKQVAIVTAEQQREVTVVNAEARKQQTLIDAEAERSKTETVSQGVLAAAINDSEGIKARGAATANAQELLLLAPVTAQTTLAKEIGANEGYQAYLIGVAKIEAGQTVGVELAKAIGAADVKIIANSGDVQGGVASVGDLFTARGGTNLTGMLEAIAQGDVGKELISKITDGVSGVIKPKAAPRNGSAKQ